MRLLFFCTVAGNEVDACRHRSTRDDRRALRLRSQDQLRRRARDLQAKTLANWVIWERRPASGSSTLQMHRAVGQVGSMAAGTETLGVNVDSKGITFQTAPYAVHGTSLSATTPRRSTSSLSRSSAVRSLVTPLFMTGCVPLNRLTRSRKIAASI
jgi:hypothetical protein